LLLITLVVQVEQLVRCVCTSLCDFWLIYAVSPWHYLGKFRFFRRSRS